MKSWMSYMLIPRMIRGGTYKNEDEIFYVNGSMTEHARRCFTLLGYPAV